MKFASEHHPLCCPVSFIIADFAVNATNALAGVGTSEIPVLDECIPLKKRVIPDINHWTFPKNLRNVKRNSSVNFITEIVAQGLLLDHKWLPVLVQCKDFKIEEIEEIFKDQEHLIRLKFTNHVKELSEEAYLMNVRSGELFLLPDHYWLIKSGKCSFWSEKEPYVTTWSNVFEYNKFSAPQLISRTLKTNYSKNKECITREIKYEFFPLTQADKSIYTLSHYGLPEPEFEIRRGRFQAFRYLLMAVGTVLILVAIYRLYKQKKSSESNSRCEEQDAN